ncbi:hypothetical protein KEJ15_07055 [Candidatus Bathyarchaeota archaeon]|nr:hypothetical protein [Candidatus Bathyarchaeota archaeon]
MTGEIFSDDSTTLQDVLSNKFLMVHELAEISELKKIGMIINKQVILNSPKIIIYKAHFTAMELELKYAMLRRNYEWAKLRLRQHKESVLDNDPNLPEALRPCGEELYSKFKSLLK